MIKTITSFMALFALCFMASYASATDAAATGGAALTITVDTSATGIPGASDLVFQPSAQISISVSTVKTSFAATSGHDAVQGKEAGQNYGMASDSSNVFWVSALTTPYAAIDTTNSSFFGSPWNRS